MSSSYKNIADLPSLVSLLPLAGVMLLPRGLVPLNMFELRYLQLVEDSLARGRLIGIIQPRDTDGTTDDASPSLHDVGCLGRITSFDETTDGRMLITLTGIARFRIVREHSVVTPYRQVHVDYRPYAQDLIADVGVLDINRERLLEVLRLYLERHGLAADWEAIEKTPNESLVNALSIISPYGVREKQALLEAETLSERNEILIALTEMALAESNHQNGDNDNTIQ